MERNQQHGTDPRGYSAGNKGSLLGRGVTIEQQLMVDVTGKDFPR